MSRGKRRLLVVLVSLVTAVCGWAGGLAVSSDESGPAASPREDDFSGERTRQQQQEGVGDDVAAAASRLAVLVVKGRAAKTGYHRSVFGRAWSDAVDVEFGRNGCSTRDDILRRDLTQVQMQGRCKVLAGWLSEPYTGASIRYERGVTVREISIDHVVALADAWQKGAQSWPAQRRLAFANDPRNLLAVSGPANSQKRDGDAATWLPKNKAYRCVYVAKQIEVKYEYRLWVTQAEKAAMMRVLDLCRSGR